MPFSDILTPVGLKLGKKSPSKKLEDTTIAVEFENETENGFELPRITGWRTHDEGSLRGFGFEYVFAQPVALEKAREMVIDYFDKINSRIGENNPLSCSPRTSTHVHLDVSLMNIVQVISFASIYWLLEPLFSEFCGDTRKGNLFCLRLRDSSAFQSSLTRGIKQGEIYRSQLFDQNSRYGSLNFNSILKFGSLESRLMRGLSEPRVAINWMDMLAKCREFSLQFKSPLDLHDKFLDKFNSDEFHFTVLGKNLALELENYLPKLFNIREQVQDSFLRISPVLLSGGDWTFAEAIEKEKTELKAKIERERAFDRQMRETLAALTPTRAAPLRVNTWATTDDNPFDIEEGLPSAATEAPVTPQPRTIFAEEDSLIMLDPNEPQPIDPDELLFGDV